MTETSRILANALLPWTAIPPALEKAGEPYFKASGTVVDCLAPRQLDGATPRTSWVLLLCPFAGQRVYAEVHVTNSQGVCRVYSATCQAHWGVKFFLEAVSSLGGGPTRECVADSTDATANHLYMTPG